jgi:hypothetical protein
VTPDQVTVGEEYVGMGSSTSADAFGVRLKLPGGWVVVQHRGLPPSVRHCKTIYRTKAEQESIEGAAAP